MMSLSVFDILTAHMQEAIRVGSTLYHTLLYVPWSRDLIERNIYGCSNQIEDDTKQWETHAGSDHHTEQSYTEFMPIRSNKCRFYDDFWLKW